MGGEKSTLAECFLDAVDRFANARAQMYRGADTWQSIPAAEVLRRVAGLSATLRELGIKSGDRVGIFAPNCPEWHIADFATLGLGAVSVPVYFRESPERVVYILRDSGARIVFAVGDDRAQVVLARRKDLPDLEKIVAARASAEIQKEVVRYETVIAQAVDAQVIAYRQQAPKVDAKELATIIYTSGTTGEPKGVMLSHANLTSNARGFSEDFETKPGDIALSLLPLAHVYERTVDYGSLFRGVSVAYVEQPETVSQALLEVRPTTVSAVPRLYEKVYANIIETGHRMPGAKKKIFDWAIETAREAILWRAYGKSAAVGLRLRWQIANALVYSKIRAGVGGRIRTFSSGGAPLAPELCEFFWSVGLPVYQGYGLTETSPVVTFSSPKSNKVGTVGRPIPGVEIRTAQDGEIFVKGTCVMQGYYHKPEQTREVLSADGWLATGDIGRIDEDGFLIITDRKKELLKTAGGKFVAPAPIENLLKTSPLISNAMVVGDGRKFVSVLIVPNFAGIEAEARKAGKDFSTPQQAINDSWVRELITQEVERVTASLAQYEKPKRFALIEQDFTLANGEVTYTLKLKRRIIEEHYRDTIARMYADVEEPRPQRAV